VNHKISFSLKSIHQVNQIQAKIQVCCPKPTINENLATVTTLPATNQSMKNDQLDESG